MELHQIHENDPRKELSKTLIFLYSIADPKKVAKANEEILSLVRQLHSLGHEVRIKDFGDGHHRDFIRLAVKAGALRQPADALEAKDHSRMSDFLEEHFPSKTWARDYHVKIDGKLEKPGDVLDNDADQDSVFGEGGAMVQVGPKEWLVAKHIMGGGSRVKKYEQRGHVFFPMPDSLLFDKTLSELFDSPVYFRVPHIDLSLGGIPERKVVAVCPNYYSEHKLSVQFMEQKLGVTTVEVPKEEADRNPANFLPLGSGRVLVDSGAPKFIQRLKEAGIEAIPTVVPLDSLLVNKGGLHCLFNEL